MANYNDKFNDQVFTPEYLADMMCKLGCVNNDSIDNDNAIARYAEVIDLVLGNNPTTHYYTKDNGLLVEDTITLNGDDFTYQQHHVIDTTPTEEDFKKTVEEYLLWKINNQFKQQGSKYGIYKF